MSAKKLPATPSGLQKEMDEICNRLRSKVKTKPSTSYHKRVEVFKGKQAVTVGD